MCCGFVGHLAHVRSRVVATSLVGVACCIYGLLVEMLECPDELCAAESMTAENMSHSLTPSSQSRGLSAMDGSGIETSDDIGVTFWP